MSSAPDLSGLRVLAFCDYFSPRSPGGSERVAAEVYRRMAGWGAQIIVVGGLPRFLRDDEISEWVHGVAIVSVPAVDLSALVGAQVSLSAALSGEAGRALRRLRPNVLTAQSLHFQSSVVAALLQRRHRVPLVTTVHVAGIEDLPAHVRVPTAAYEASLGRFILRRSRRVIAVSDAVSAHLAGKVESGRVVVIGNGVDHEAFAPQRERQVREPPVVAFVGRLIANKGPQHLIEALGRLDDQGVPFRGLFVGDGPLRGSLEERSKALRLDDRVTFTGPVSDVGARLRDADIFVRPSSSEGMSLALLEAMACGLCPVVSDIPANSHLVSHGVSGMLSPVGDHTMLADALARVLRDRGLREDLAAAATAVAARYSWDACARNTASVLSGVADQSAPMAVR